MPRSLAAPRCLHTTARPRGASQGCPKSIPTPRILPAGRVPESIPALIGFSSPSHPTSLPVIAEGVARATQRLPQSTKGTDEAGPARPVATATTLPDPRTRPQPGPVRGQSPECLWRTHRDGEMWLKHTEA